MNAIPCQQFKGHANLGIRKRDEVRVDPLSVDLCLNCTEPECYGAKRADRGGYNGPPRCAYEAAVMGRRNVTMVALPGPRPDGVMRTWECEVER